MRDDVEVTVTIDLGEYHDVEPEQTQLSLSPRARRTAALALAALVLLPVGGSARPALDPFPRRGTITVAFGDQIYVDGDRSYLVSRQGQRSRVDAYDIRDGARLWSTVLPVAGAVSTMWAGAGQLSLQTDTKPGGISVLDLAGGRPVWSADAAYLPVPERAAMLVAGGADTLALVDAASGAPRWTVPFGGCVVSGYTRDAGGAAIAAVARCGDEPSIRVIAMADGRTVASRRVSALVPHPHGVVAYLSQPVVAGDMVVIDEIGGDPDLLVGIRLDDLTPLWSAPPPVPGKRVFACGNSLCQYARDGVTTLDPHTGRTRGLLTPAGPSPPARPAVARPDGPGLTIVLNPDPSVPIAGDDVFGLTDGARPLPAYAKSGRVWVAAAEPDPIASGRIRIRVLGRLTGVSPGGCFATRRYLACASAPDQLTFYGLPPGITHR